MKWIGIALVLLSAFAHADANQDAFNAGASFGKGSKQSAGSLKNADTGGACFFRSTTGLASGYSCCSSV